MLSFTTRAVGGTHAGDRTEIRRALALLITTGDRHELRALPGGQGRIALGDDLDAATQAAMDLSDQMVYFSLNPIKRGESRASKKTVTKRVWFLIDIDPVRPRDVSATDEESGRAYAIAATIADALLDRGWPAPVIVDSGNGWHLLYRIDLPNDKLAQELLKAALVALAEEHNSPWAIVDRATHDAPRISKLPGTWARKGPDTPDRPHRLCRIVFEPDTVEVVTVDQIRDLGSPSPAQSVNGAPQAPSFATVASDGPGKTAYVRSAIERECYRVMIAPNGTRNDSLNRAAFALGQFESWPEMDAPAALASLKQAADHCGLPEGDTRKTIESGWKAGAQQPRPRPLDPATSGPPNSGKVSGSVPPSGKRIIWGRSVKPRKVEWLDPGRIPIGKMTTFAGQTGLGKTFTLCELAARVTRGMEIPFSGGKTYQQGKVLLISAEDDADDTIVPRFLGAGGDLDRLALLSPESEEHFSLAALDLLNGCLEDMGPDVRMVAIDPPTSYLGRVDDHKNGELRGLLRPLRNWCRDRRVALILVTHVNKASGPQKVEALARVMGGVAWVTAVRSAHMFCPDPTTPGRCLYLPLKANNSGERKGLAYRIVPTDSLARLEWIEEVTMSADEAMNTPLPRKTAGACAVEWLQDRFREKRSWKSRDLIEMAQVHGFSYNAIAKSGEVRALPIRKKEEFDADGKSLGWHWHAKYGWPPEKPSETPECLDVSVGSVREFPLSDKDDTSRKTRESGGSVVSDGLSGEPESGSSLTGQGLTGGVSGVSGIDGIGAREVINKIFKPF